MSTEQSAFRFQPRFTISERFNLPPGSMRSQPPGDGWNWFKRLFGYPWIGRPDKK